VCVWCFSFLISFVFLPQDKRESYRVLVLGPGFGARRSPGDPARNKVAFLKHAGYANLKVSWENVQDPDSNPFDLEASLKQIKSDIDDFSPDVVVCASRSGIYMTQLWEQDWWTGPSVMLNAHPSFKSLPANVPVIVAHGSKDKTFKRDRTELEKIFIDRPSASKAWLYYSQEDAKGIRKGDSHAGESWLKFDLLPRFVDAVLSGNPCDYMIKSWRRFLPAKRLQAEQVPAPALH
jgi:hypothetical protein